MSSEAWMMIGMAAGGAVVFIQGMLCGAAIQRFVGRTVERLSAPWMEGEFGVTFQSRSLLLGR